MSRLVNVSNRVALPRAADAAGGLAVGLRAAMRESGGLWFGWSGKTCAPDAPHSSPSMQRRAGVCFATIDIPEPLYEPYYSGFSNGTLWPLLHYFLNDLRYQDRHYEAYLAVNQLFARDLLPLLRPDDLVWVHDYHLIPLGTLLRAQGTRVPLGFFLHVPFPDFEVLRVLPVHAELLHHLLAYDLIGFQTEVDRQAFLGAARAVCGAASVNSSTGVVFGEHPVRTGVFPIGIDADAIARAAARGATSSLVQSLAEGLQGRDLIIGVDRLDYSKGLLERFEAYEHFLDESPQYRSKVTYLQIALLGRQSVRAYRHLRHQLAQSAGRINGRFGDVDWTPIRYVNRNLPHGTLMALLRLARVCLVTPLRDGMNLVAKEFIGAQNPADPGVLVLSERAGAAHELTEALQVNPTDTRGVGRALRRALDMPRSERSQRHEQQLEAVRSNNIYSWSSRFVAALAGELPQPLPVSGTARSGPSKTSVRQGVPAL
ncbi:MAG TPA: trehalose-6-phosphate synthase [Steroidobacteraceae bacterium]